MTKWLSGLKLQVCSHSMRLQTCESSQHVLSSCCEDSSMPVAGEWPQICNFNVNSMNACINANSTHEFYIVAFSMSSVGQLVLFLGIMIIYLLTFLGNVSIIILVYFAAKLHTPMYFFLCNLAVVDITSSSTCIPKLLTITLTQDHRISFDWCMTQMFFFLLCANGEIFMLTSMAFDRYVAICKPLQYHTIMRKNVYVVLAASAWTVATLNSISHVVLTSILEFCNSHDINNFFCDLNSVIALSSTDVTSRKVFMFFETVLISVERYRPILESIGIG
ncbi:unnamed protein product [Ranitomeya imitator]|uniref:Olfactory receptor n=1 Tax=Ranitomeya imitator TaxID=111125 RepID=A0ABN9M1M4_9NEOB|nr:unnamed protein product [Ranitomeya imitator]